MLIDMKPIEIVLEQVEIHEMPIKIDGLQTRCNQINSQPCHSMGEEEAYLKSGETAGK